MRGQLESWVTLATNDSNAWNALVLAKSLRRTSTSRKLTVIITDQVSPELKFVLAKEFDFVEKVENSDLKLWNCTADLLVLWCWNLKGGLGKCVFVNSNSIAIRNCDQLFDLAVETFPLTRTGNGNSIVFDLSLFVFQPNRKMFNELIKITNENGGLNKSLTNYTRDNCDSTAKIVKLDEEHWKRSNTNDYSPEMLWLKIYAQDILGLILKEEKQDLKTLLLKSLISIGLPVEFPSSLGNQILDTKTPIPEELLDSVAVIGMSCRFPESNTPQEFWDFLCSGEDGIRHYPADRPRSQAHFSDEFYNIVKAGFLKCTIDEFDCKFFGVSPREAEIMDPQQRILLEVAWESFESAGINPLTLKGNSKTGVFVGVWQQEYDRMFVPVLAPMHYKQLGNSFGATASRISYFLGLVGPNVAIESGCSSSLAALHLACESLRRGETNLAVAGGVNIIHVMPLPGQNKTLAPDFHCKTYDESADGFGRGEGCGVLILKRFGDAWADGDNILAAVRGSAVNNDGASQSFGTPFAPGHISVAKAALARAKVDPLEVSYLESHGTGTAVGDPIEFYGVSQVYGESPQRQRPRPMFLSSVKTNIGHTESAAGIAGVIKVILAMQAKKLPPHRNLKKINPKINLNIIPAQIPTQVTEWICSEGEMRIASVSASSLSGNNGHVVLQEVPPRMTGSKNGHNANATQIVTLSAKTQQALDVIVEKYIQFSKANPEISLADLAFTTNCGRAHFAHRLAIISKASTIADFGSKLELGSFETSLVDSQASQKLRIGFLFTGQGSQYAGMGGELFKSSEVFRFAYFECNLLFKAKLGLELKEVWENSNHLAQTLYSQPSLFCLQYCLIKLWESLGVKPDLVLGHSVGEFAATVAAGILSLASAMDLVMNRSNLIDKLVNPGSMVAVKQSQAELIDLISKFNMNNNKKNVWVDLAAINSLGETVIAGPIESIQLFIELCQNIGIKTKMLSGAAHAFHSRAMDFILKDYEKVAQNLKYDTNLCTYVSSAKASVINSYDFSPTYWLNHVRDPVQYSDAIQIASNQVDILIEIGPHPILLSLAMANNIDLLYCPTLRRTESTFATLATSLSKLYLAGIKIDWNAWHGEGHSKISNLPFYPFQRKGQKFWFRSSEDVEAGNSNFGDSVHPILGSQIPSPLSSTTIAFHNCITFNKLDYFADHSLGGHVIFPAAAYLETMLAAGVYDILGISKSKNITNLPPLCLENFFVGAPVELHKSTTIQTIIVKKQDSSSCSNITVFRQIGSLGQDKWKSHAEASFEIFPKQRENQINFGNINLDQVKSRLEIQDRSCYIKLTEIGYTFGPNFQRISKMWAGEGECLTCIQVDALTVDDDYFCHPILLDAMVQTATIQLIGSLVAKGDASLFMLPVGVNKYVWLGKSFAGLREAFCYSKTDPDGDSISVFLCNQSGEILAFLGGVEFLKKSLPEFIKSLKHNEEDGHIKLPPMYEFTWRQVLGLNRSRIHPSSDLTPSVGKSSKTYQSIAEVGSMNSSFAQLIERLSFLYICKAIQEIGWEWKVGKPLSVELWKSKLPDTMKNFKLIEAYFDIFKKQKTLLDENYIPKALLPTVIDIEIEIQQISESLAKEFPEDGSTLKFVTKCGENLNCVLQGEKTGLSILFPQDTSEFSVQEFYAHSKFMQPNLKIIRSIFSDTISPLLERTKHQNHGIIRILEFGAGTGATTAEVLSALAQFDLTFEYTFTDTSTYFLNEGKKRFGSFGTKMHYRLLNLEENPLSQGFAPNNFDIIIGNNVVHCTKDLCESLQNIRILLREGGVLIMGELFKRYSYLVLTFGLVDGWWRFSDQNNIRTISPLVDTKTWETLVLKSGFSYVRSVEISNGSTGCIVANCGAGPCGPLRRGQVNSQNKTWLLIGDQSDGVTGIINDKLKNNGRQCVLVKFCSLEKIDFDDVYMFWRVNPTIPSHFIALLDKLKTTCAIEGILYLADERTFDLTLTLDKVQKQLCSGLLHLLQAVLSKYDAATLKPKFICITRGVHAIGNDSPPIPCSATLWGIVKVFSSENPSYQTRLVDLENFKSGSSSKDEADELFSQLWENFSQEHFMAIRDGKLLVQRVVHATSPLASRLEYTKTPNFEFSNKGVHVLSDLQIVPAADKGQHLEASEVEVAIKATSLNFRDLLCILQPDGFTFGGKDDQFPGFDFSGKITKVGSNVSKFKVGDPVFGYTDSGSFASHTIVPQDFLAHKSSFMTYPFAAAIPGVFLTSYSCLITLAQLKVNDRVLIHLGAGGIGLAAIQIAKATGASIYTTAGSERKRNYLREILGIKYVYNSRDTKYGDEILRDTQGQGVTVVLNSLTSENFKETTLKACAKGAIWLEIAKLNIWSEAQIKKLRPDIHYSIFDLYTMAKDCPGQIGQLLEQFNNAFTNGIYSEIPTTVFALDQLKDAFTYFQEGKQIGKIVIKMPDYSIPNSPQTKYFNTESTYVITGGLGGIGLEIAGWILKEGGKYVALVGRSNPTPYAGEEINRLNKLHGGKILVLKADVSTRSECARVLSEIKATSNYPPIRGIMHAAGCASDGVILSQTWDKFDCVFNSKVYSAWHFHELTKNYNLEFFVLFSSMASVFGTYAQANHAGANAYLDSLGNYRQSLGLPSTTINWGAWADVGMAVKVIDKYMHEIIPFTPAQGTAALESVMKNKDQNHVMIGQVVSWERIKEFYNIGQFMSELKEKPDDDNRGQGQPFVKLQINLTNEMRNGTKDQVRVKISEYVGASLCLILRIPNHEILDENASFFDLGVDSLMFMEFRNILQKMLAETWTGKVLTLEALQQNKSVKLITQYILQLLYSDSEIK